MKTNGQHSRVPPERFTLFLTVRQNGAPLSDVLEHTETQVRETLKQSGFSVRNIERGGRKNTFRGMYVDCDMPDPAAEQAEPDNTRKTLAQRLRELLSLSEDKQPAKEQAIITRAIQTVLSCHDVVDAHRVFN